MFLDYSYYLFYENKVSETCKGLLHRLRHSFKKGNFYRLSIKTVAMPSHKVPGTFSYGHQNMPSREFLDGEAAEHGRGTAPQGNYDGFLIFT